MVFRDRQEAGLKLADLLEKENSIDQPKNTILLSLLKGGSVVGDVLAKKFHLQHLPLPVVKISPPHESEYALGAVCCNKTYLNDELVNQLQLKEHTTAGLVLEAQKKCARYINRFDIKERSYAKLKNKQVIIVDDGVATGATAQAALLFIKSHNPSRVILAFPVGPYDVYFPEADRLIIYDKQRVFVSVSLFYDEFPSISEEEVKRIFTPQNIPE